MNKKQEFKEQSSDQDVVVIDKRHTAVDAPVVRDDSPNAMIMQAMAAGYKPELIEKMMDLAERNERNIAKKAHFRAVANFKADAPRVKKDKYNNWLKCYYTSLGNLLDTYNPFLALQGLSLSFLPPEQDDKSMTVECRLSHSMGHTESVRMTGPIDTAAVGKQSGKASRNPMQDIRSTFTYLRSTTCEAILGVAGTEGTQDDDGNAAGEDPVERISTDQATVITDLIKETGTKKALFLKWCNCESVEEIQANSYKIVLAELNRKKKQMREPGDE